MDETVIFDYERQIVLVINENVNTDNNNLLIVEYSFDEWIKLGNDIQDKQPLNNIK